MANSEILDNLEELLRSSEIGMYRHYWAARRCRRFQRLVSISQIVINVLLGSVFLYAITEELPSFAKWIGATLALVVAAVGGLEYHLGLATSFEKHHRIANDYRAIARNAELLRAEYNDQLIDLSHVAARLTELHQQYDSITHDAEAFITRQSDYRKAQSQQAARQNRVGQRRVAQQLVGPDAGKRVSQLDSSSRLA